LSKFGIVPRFITVDEMREPERAISDRTRLFWFESPNNPHLRCVDIKRIADACRERNVLSVIDNTFASPINQRPLAMGIDLAMQSATKYLNGHSDVTAGVVCGSRALVRPVEMARRKLGGVLDPQPAYALNRALKTLEIRIQRHNANAMAVASALDGHPALARVYYPGLASHPDHRVAKCQMSGFGGMVCIDVAGGEAAAYRTFDRLKIIKRAASLGGTESLCSLPILTSQWGHTDAQLEAAGISKGMMRLSIGLEDPQDLIDDLKQALA
jgi:cystathionine beta-lyase/cystathionine gamma-synthase